MHIYCIVLAQALLILRSFPTRRSSDLWCVLVEDQLAEVYRVQTVSIFFRVNQFQDAVFVEMLRQRQLDDVAGDIVIGDRKSTRLNSSHVAISYAVFCLKKKK